MFGGMAHKIGILAKKATGGGGGDVTLNPTPNWADAGGSPAETGSETMQGIDTAITLRIVQLGSDGGWEYRKNTDSWIAAVDVNTDVSMSNGDYIKFRNIGTFSGYTTVIEVYNYTDGNTLLDTITLIND